MTLDDLIERLDNTIKGKELLLNDMLHYSTPVGNVTAAFLRINLNELRKIRTDANTVREGTGKKIELKFEEFS